MLSHEMAKFLPLVIQDLLPSHPVGRLSHQKRLRTGDMHVSACVADGLAENAELGVLSAPFRVQLRTFGTRAHERRLQVLIIIPARQSCVLPMADEVTDGIQDPYTSLLGRQPSTIPA